MSPRHGCGVNGCRRPILSGGYCSPHYQRNRRYGDPEGGRPIDTNPGERKTFRGVGKIRCEICGEPVNDHPIGAHRIGEQIIEGRLRR